MTEVREKGLSRSPTYSGGCNRLVRPRRHPNLRGRQRGYLLVMVIIMLFLVASIAMLLNQGSAISASMSTSELETTRLDYVTRAATQHALWAAGNNACMGDVTIPDTTLGADSYSATVTGAAAGTLYQLAADQDAWIRSDDVTASNGTTVDQHIRLEGGNIEYALTRFDLSTLPKGAQINSAIAWFYVAGGGKHPEGPLTVHNVTADWNEAGATWESMGSEIGPATLAVIPAQDDDGIWVSINLTGQVQAWANGQPNYGILMASSAEGVHAKYASREDGSHPPRLEVVVGSGPASPVTIKANGRLDNGVSRARQDQTATAYQSAAYGVLQPGAEGKDGWVNSTQTTNNYGAAAEMTITGGANPEHFLIQFPVERIPRGSRVISARMEMYLNWLGSADPAAEFSVHRMTQSWSEGSGDNWNPGDGANWKTSDGSENWDWQTNHDANVAVDTALVDPGFTGWHAWDVTQLVQRWATGDQANHGMVIKGNDKVSKAWFRSSDWADAQQHPRLIVEYACECGSPCMMPQGAGTIAMVVINPTTLVPADAYKKALFESWGYTVDVIGESANQAAYDAKATNSDVFFISESVNSNQVGNRLVDVSIGVVSQDGSYSGDLGFESAASSNWPVGSGLNVTDNSHYITAPFAAGALQIYDADMGGLAIGGTPATGVQSLADWGGSSGLAVLEAGAETADGGAAAGRRVMLPFGRVSEMNWGEVNNNGFLILQRALDWAMNKKNGLRILLVVGIDTALQTRDTARRDLFESWGYAVTIIDDGATLAEFEAATALNDVAYVAGTVVDGTLAGKLETSTLGIVNEVGGQLDDLGFHGNATANIVVSDNFTATNAFHYISEPFAGSGVSHFTTTIGMPVAAAPMAPSLGSVGSLGALTWGIPVLGTGAERWDSELSAGRRVHLPFGAAEVSQLTDDGMTLMRRAIEWAGGAGTESGKVLFVVGSTGGAGMTDEETAHQALIESWGYTVEIIDAGASQGAFDAALATKDVVFITNDVTASNVGTKLVDATVGVVTSEDNLSDEFGLASGIAWESGNVLNIDDNTHYITMPFDTGPLTVFTSSQSLARVTGSFAPDLQQLASASSEPMLISVAAGGSLYGGGNAAGRRVQLPWGGAGFDPGNLTADGLTILQRALEWGAGLGGGSVDIQVTDGSDDAEQLTSSGEMEVTSSDLELADNLAATGQPSDIVGIRFPNVAIPQGESITNAYIQFQVDELDSGGASLTIEGEAVDNAAQFTTAAYNITSRPRTSASVLWTPPEWTTVGERGPDQRTVDISPLIQEIVNRSGWSSGNALAIIISGTGTRTAEAFEGDPAGAPLLHIDFGAGGGGGGDGGGGDGGGGDGGGGIFRDEFNTAGSYGGNDGTLSWATDWLEIGEADGPNRGDERVTAAPVSGYLVQVQDNDNGGEGLEREADLSAYTSATLTFIYWRSGLDNANDYVTVDVSDNGGSSWTEIDRFAGPASDTQASPQSASHDISAYIAPNTRIRFLTSPNMGGADKVRFDNVQIEVH